MNFAVDIQKTFERIKANDNEISEFLLIWGPTPTVYQIIETSLEKIIFLNREINELKKEIKRKESL